MGIFYYICCFGCCGLFGRRRFVKEMTTESNEKTIKRLHDISLGSERRVAKSTDPLKTKTLEMITNHRISNQKFKTEEDVLRSYGYRMGVYINRGAAGLVYKAEHLKSGQTIACKKIVISKEKQKSLMKGIKREVFALEKIRRHRHIIYIFNHFMITYRKERTLYIFMQFAPRTLSKHRDDNGPYNEDSCKIWFAQILSAVSYMHSNDIAHRDLKLSNILLDETDDVLVTDFGTSRLVSYEGGGKELESRTICGTPQYMAPELLEKTMKYRPFTLDIWSLGIILFDLYNGIYPFEVTKDPVVIKTAIKNMKARNYSFSKPPTPALHNIIYIMLEPVSEKRPTVKQLYEHEWIADKYREVDKRAKEWMKEMP